jgi:4-hydroxy-tetrahydrodipicolinate synthase
MTSFRGTYTVLITPLTDDGTRVDVPALRQLVEWQIAEGIHGLVPLGSTGEFLSLAPEERLAVIETCITTAAKRVPVLVGTGAEWTDECIRLSREAESMGADGVMIIPPYYSAPTDDEVFEHYRRVGDSIALPIMVYNNPATANIDLKPPLVARISEIDNCSYIKESTRDVTRVRDIIDLCGDRMTVFAGILGYESFCVGAQGWVAVCSNLIPRMSAKLFELVADDRDLDGALKLYRQMTALVNCVGDNRYVAATKEGLALMGLPVGKPRPPRLPQPPHEFARLHSALVELGLLDSIALGNRTS